MITGRCFQLIHLYCASSLSARPGGGRTLAAICALKSFSKFARAGESGSASPVSAKVLPSSEKGVRLLVVRSEKGVRLFVVRS